LEDIFFSCSIFSIASPNGEKKIENSLINNKYVKTKKKIEINLPAVLAGILCFFEVVLLLFFSGLPSSFSFKRFSSFSFC